MKTEETIQEREEKAKWIAAAWDTLYLVQCGINSMVPDAERVSKMDLEKVYARSKSQSLEALTYMALENLMKSDLRIQIPDKTQVLPKWKEAKDRAIAKNMMMDVAREQLFAFLEERGAWHMVLKGAVLCHMYPKYGMRQMADNDILFDPSFRQEVHDWFVEQGYKVESFQESNHDEYHKKPVYNFEMHTALFNESEQPQLARYYRTIKEKLIRRPGKVFEYYMTDEDFYLYIVAHEYKHYSGNGTGLRSLLDLYVCNKVKTSMDYSYLEQELDQMGILEFGNGMRELANKVFNPETMEKVHAGMLSEEEQVILKELVSSCTYKNTQKYWNRRIGTNPAKHDQITASVKLRYLIRRLFPDRVYMQMWCRRYAPYFVQHRWLMPAAPAWRMIKRGIEKRKQIKEELDIVKKV